MPTRSHASTLHLLAALFIVIGLAVSVPPSCWCVRDDHFGVLLHPLFPHRHADDHGAYEPESDALANISHEVERQAPGISAPLGATGIWDISGGEILLPSLLALGLLMTTRFLRTRAASLDQVVLAPLTPPPRV
jgi:hypothetical protein